MHIQKSHEHIPSSDLIWDEKERSQVERDILGLRDDQIGALAKILVEFNDKEIPDIVDDIRENGTGSGHLSILLEEADSKEKVCWWVEYFKNSKK